MKTEDILAIPPKVLSPEQREFYFENGYLLVERAVGDELLERLRAVTAEMVEKSREITCSDAVFDLEPSHSRETPRLRRLSSPAEHHPLFWEYASQSVTPDIVADLVGPDVKFHHSKLNFKWSEGGEEVMWHQDIQYWPHTNYSPLTVGLYLDDVGPDQGPLGVVPGSHQGELYDQYNDKGQWVGCLSEAARRKAGVENAEFLTGPAGSLTVHKCRTIHGSRTNQSAQRRPLLLNTYSSADAFPYTANPLNSSMAGAIVRGEPAAWAHHDPRPCLMPPDWSGGYTSLFAVQREEEWAEEQYRRQDQ